MFNKIFNKQKDSKLVFYGAMHALGVLAYVSLVALFMNNAERIFGKKDNFLTPIIALMLFIISALITGSLVLLRPIYFYLEGQKKEAFKLLAYTAICLVIIFVLVILAYLLLR
jgi:hypothetical protein